MDVVEFRFSYWANLDLSKIMNHFRGNRSYVIHSSPLHSRSEFGNDALLEWVYRVESILNWTFSKSEEFVLHESPGYGFMVLF